ncbi:MAG: hypothetical protein JNM40_18745 [Myxococcales bacterium]|nr:hypothetical protein [Myxococcales bacterium]
MNKPILAACAGVTFGLFLGGLVLSGNSGGRSCHRRMTTETRTTQSQRVVITSTVIHHSSEGTHSQTRQQITEVVTGDDADILTAAQVAYVNGDYAQAIAIAKRASTDSPTRAYRIIGSAACSLGDVEQATQAYRRLDPAGRQYVTYVCQRSGIVQKGNTFARSPR